MMNRALVKHAVYPPLPDPPMPPLFDKDGNSLYDVIFKRNKSPLTVLERSGIRVVPADVGEGHKVVWLTESDCSMYLTPEEIKRLEEDEDVDAITKVVITEERFYM